MPQISPDKWIEKLKRLEQKTVYSCKDGDSRSYLDGDEVGVALLYVQLIVHIILCTFVLDTGKTEYIIVPRLRSYSPLVIVYLTLQVIEYIGPAEEKAYMQRH